VIAENSHQIQNDANTRIMSNGTLIVAAVQQEDEGWYTCTAENKGKYFCLYISLLLLLKG
jgi:hypothetical protein